MLSKRSCKLRSEFNWLVIFVDKLPTLLSLISLNKCSTPISSASSASIEDGICMKVWVVSVPSYYSYPIK